MDASKKIDEMIARTADWRGETLAALRKAVLEADQRIVEEWKWMGSPVWSCEGIVAVGNPHKDKVKLTLMYGAKLADPDKLFNAGFNGNERRAIDFFEGDKVNAPALKKLIRAHIAYNEEKRASKAAPAKKAKVAVGKATKTTATKKAPKKK
jgi:hypothetical protein